MKVLHYKSNFLNASETFIHRVIANHQQFTPVGMCIEKRTFTENLPTAEKPQTGIEGLINTLCFHLNWCLPFYNDTIRKANPAIIHAHFGFDGYRMMNPARKNNIPLIVSFYGSDVSRLPTEFDWPRRYCKLAKSAEAFIAASALMKKQLIDLGFPEEKIYVIPFGIDLNQFAFKLARPQNKKLMMVGRMVEKKGFIYALKAIKILDEENTAFELDLYGDGPLRKTLEQQTQKWGIDHLVHFHGYVPIKKISEEHYNHPILLAPSITAADGDQEGLPNTILEAMACGTPVIATNHAAIGEAIIHKKTGFLVSNHNASEIAQAIQYITANTTLVSNMQKNAYAKIQNDFEITGIVDRIEHLYQQVIDNYA